MALRTAVIPVLAFALALGGGSVASRYDADGEAVFGRAAVGLAACSGAFAVADWHVQTGEEVPAGALVTGLTLRTPPGPTPCPSDTSSVQVQLIDKAGAELLASVRVPFDNTPDSDTDITLPEPGVAVVDVEGLHVQLLPAAPDVP